MLILKSFLRKNEIILNFQSLTKHKPMRLLLTLFFVFIFSFGSIAQNGTPEDYLSAAFHKERREALRASMPANSVAVFFANPLRNRANDVDYVYHQDPNFYYLTGYKEPHAVSVIFLKLRTFPKGITITRNSTYNNVMLKQSNGQVVD